MQVMLMELIDNHNCVGTCCHEYCGEYEKYFMKLNLNEMTILLAFCERHSEEFEDKFWRYSDARRESDSLLQGA